MIVISDTLKTFDNKVNKIKTLAKKKYYLQKTLERINKEIKTDLLSLNDLENISVFKFITHDILSREEKFRTHVLNLLIKHGGR